ncbi:MAG: hypothetical protein HOP28_18260 [Gemmatimonadales bacterium]|nr:hypothetical protein [Gemmatimonadales bacterium]
MDAQLLNRRLARTVAGMVLTIAACGSPDVTSAPAPPPPPPPAAVPTVIGLGLRPAFPVRISVGDFLGVTADLRGVSGERLPLRPGVTYRSSAPDIASVSSDGIVQILSGGEATITASFDTFVSNGVLVVAQVPSGSFRITLAYADDVPARWREALESAARRWEQAVAGELPPVELNTTGGDCPTPPGEPTSPPLHHTERGVHIYVGQSGRFPPGAPQEAIGGPCINRPLPTPTTILGTISLNRAHPAATITSERLRFLAVHEMGHVLGLVGVIQGPQVPWFSSVTGIYRGPMAIEGWRRAFGNAPIEIYERGGAHWGPMLLNDVMLGSLFPEISLVSVGALADLGFPIAWTGVGIY